MGKFVLKETLASKKQGRPIYFAKYIRNFGPANTADLKEAQVFESVEDARQSPAMRFSLCFYDIIPLPEE